MNTLLLSLIDFSAFSDTEAVLRMRAADPDGAFLWALMGVTMILLIAYFRQRISTGHGKTLPGAVLPPTMRITGGAKRGRFMKRGNCSGTRNHLSHTSFANQTTGVWRLMLICMLMLIPVLLTGMAPAEAQDAAAELTVGGVTTPYITLKDALDAVPAEAEDAVVKLLTDISVEQTGFDNSGFPIVVDKTVTLDLNGKVINAEGNSQHVITVRSGASLTLEDSDPTASNTCVDAGTGNTVSVSGGLITNSKGSGVYVAGINSSFTMKGGTIAGNDGYTNSGSKGGGVYVDLRCSFTMNRGTITGNNVYMGGGVYVNGKFTMTGGTISGNNAMDGGFAGGGVYVKGEFTMTGGMITGNTATRSPIAGVYVSSSPSSSSSSSITLSGSPVIADNNGINLFLASNAKINITGELTDDASVGVAMYQPGVFTSGLRGYGTAANFSSDDEEYGIALDADGEALLAKLLTVTINDIEYVTADKEKAFPGETVELTVNIPDGLILRSLKVTYVDNNGVEHEAELRETRTRSTTLTRYFDMPAYPVTVTADILTPWANLQAEINAAAAQAGGGTVILTQNVTAEPNETALIVPAGGPVTLDLAGNAIDRGLGSAASIIEDGNVITVNGSLTVTDSVTTASNTYVDSVTGNTVSVSGGVITGGFNETGGGIYVDGGTLIMNAGSVCGNAGVDGGGIYVDGGTLAMSGSASVCGNASVSGGGIYVADGSSFTISGTAAVSGNKATDASGGGIYVAAGSSTLAMSGSASVSGNVADGGGGVYFAGTEFTMSESASITGNVEYSASEEHGGGGVYLGAGTFNMSGGTIGGTDTGSANSAKYGSGVFITGGTFAMSGTASVTGNVWENASGYSYGGGVNMTGGTFEMSGGTISGNSAHDGGAVYFKDGTFNMTGGTIGGSGTNDANIAQRGSGIYIWGTPLQRSPCPAVPSPVTRSILPTT